MFMTSLIAGWRRNALVFKTTKLFVEWQTHGLTAITETDVQPFYVSEAYKLPPYVSPPKSKKQTVNLTP
jgi:hypothetical protein